MEKTIINDRKPKMSVNYAADLLGISKQALHKQLKKHHVFLPKIGNRSYLTHDTAKILFNLDFSKARKKTAIHIVKGGTGKTTSGHFLSAAASLYGAKVLNIDLDPQGNLTEAYEVKADEVPVLIDVINGHADIQESIVNVESGIDIIPSRIENVTLDNKLAVEGQPLHTLFSNLLEPIEANYDFIILDCPPNMGHTVTAAAIYTGFVLVPLNPERFSAKGLSIVKKEINNIKKRFKVNVDYRVFLNKFSANTILSDKAISTTISEETLNGKALNTAIRLSQEIPNITDAYLNIFSSLKKSTARDDFDLLARELFEIDVIAARHKNKQIQNEVQKSIDLVVEE